jgi:hypothetical protein
MIRDNIAQITSREQQLHIDYKQNSFIFLGYASCCVYYQGY